MNNILFPQIINILFMLSCKFHSISNISDTEACSSDNRGGKLFYYAMAMGQYQNWNDYCRDCYNVMYNSAPLFLADKAEEIRKLMPAQIRLDFTVENKEQVREILIESGVEELIIEEKPE